MGGVYGESSPEATLTQRVVHVVRRLITGASVEDNSTPRSEPRAGLGAAEGNETRFERSIAVGPRVVTFQSVSRRMNSCPPVKHTETAVRLGEGERHRASGHSATHLGSYRVPDVVTGNVRA